MQSIVISVEESASLSQVNAEVNFVKTKIFREKTDALLMENYQADLGLRNVREAVLKRDLKSLRRENILFRYAFKDLRIDCELFVLKFD